MNGLRSPIAATTLSPPPIGKPSTSSTSALFCATCILVVASMVSYAGGSSLLVHKYSTRVVKTKYGALRGVMIHIHPPVEAFLGVPYATPPVGSLRYMPPVTPSTWKNTKLADRFGPVCPQRPPEIGNRSEALLEFPRGRLLYLEKLLPLLTNQSEDCLYLNLYVPRTATGEEEQTKLPCVVYVHGESYEWNSGNPYDGTVLASSGRVIVVTINFRLGVLGFLKTGTKGSAQGNFGLMDLVAGLHWLRENLPAFGGDPERVTLMGHGTGAALVNFVAVSPVAKAMLVYPSALDRERSPDSSTNLERKEYDTISLDLTDSELFVSDKRLPWSEAKLVCSNRGLHLAFPQSDSDNFHLRHTIRYNYLSDPPLDRYSGFWVGGHRKINSDEFYWDNGQSIGWYGWVKHTPSTLLREDCVEMSPSIYNDEMMWTNTNCQKSQRYICYGRTTDEVSKADGSLTPGFKGNELWKNKRQLSSIVESDDNIRTMSPRPTTISSIATPITKSPSKSHQLPIIIAIENNPTTTLIPRSPSSQNSDSDSNTQSEPIHPTESPMREVWRRPHRHFHHIFATYLSNPDGFDEAHDMDIDCF